MTPCATTLKGNGHGSILVPFILLSASALYITNLGIPFILSEVILKCSTLECFPGGSDSKTASCNAGDLGSIPGLRRSPRGGHGNPLQYSCLENPHGQRSLVS